MVRTKTAKAADDGMTPMMRQFFSFKKKYPDALILFRCGDFYETYGGDAVEAAKLLGITLTRRNSGRDAIVSEMEMAGFPYHALDTYLPRLIRAGRRVAVCDQLEDPKTAKTLVRRGVTELVTPGVVMGDSVLDARENNFLAAVHIAGGSYGIALLDISTGEYLAGEGDAAYVSKMLAALRPKEVLHERSSGGAFESAFGTQWCTYALDDWAFNEGGARRTLLHHFGTTTLKGFGVDRMPLGVTAAGAILHYLSLTQHNAVAHITALARLDAGRYVHLDTFTIRSLELLQPLHDGGVSLLDVLDRTVTPMGGRLLRRWIVFPLRDGDAIRRRQDAVEYFFRHPAFRSDVDALLQHIGDIERITARAATSRVSPREVVQLGAALAAIASMKERCCSAGDDAMQVIGESLDGCAALRDRIASELRPDAPPLASRGGIIAEGYDSELDELRAISRNGRDYLLKIQERESVATGIASLRVGYNNVFGYYLEVRNTYKDSVPGTWIRKQTLANAERYITPELKEYEDKITGADERIAALETSLFAQLVSDMAPYVATLQRNANAVARADCLLSFAKTSEEHRYVRPVVDDSLTIDISAGRHPVIETQLPTGESYVPNDVCLDNTRQQIMIITGPNMSGKSALLRQTALITIMAQTGCYVPAAEAHIGMADKVFTRVGASDNIAMGESTFMVEMTEAADILNNATPRSLVLFDELGRGTSTYDGISIAWAIVEHLHEKARSQARTLFATHYHELNDMESYFARIKNYNVSVKEMDGQVMFMRKLQRGGSAHSFGIHVAEMAGMPPSVVRRATEILHQLEDSAAGVEGKRRTGKAHVTGKRTDSAMQLNFFQLDDPVLSQVRDEIVDLDIDRLTPIEALNKLYEIKKIVTGRSDK